MNKVSRVSPRRTHRACLNCRISKLRCEPLGTEDHAGFCRRCLEARCPCIYNERPRKHNQGGATGARLKESTLTYPRQSNSRYHRRNLSSSSSQDTSPTQRKSMDGEKLNNLLNASRVYINEDSTVHRLTPASSFPFENKSTRPIEAIDVPADQPITGLPQEQVQNLYRHFFDEMMRDLPLIPPRLPSKAEGDNQTTVLHLAILTVAASSLDIKTFTELDARLRHTLAINVISTGLKSVEIVRALTLAVAFYAANEPLHKARITSLAVQANCMSSDLGLYDIKCILHTNFDSCMNAEESRCIWTLAGVRISMHECLDTMQAALACLWTVNSVMVLFRRTILPHYPSCAKSYARLLRSSTTVRYQQIAAWSELEMIAVESFSHSTGTMPSHNGTEGKALLSADLTSLLDNWKETYLPCLECSKALLLRYCTVRIRLFELNLAPLSNNIYLKPPFDECILEGGGSGRPEATGSESQGALPCLDHILLMQRALDMVLSMPTKEVRVQSIMFFVDLCYILGAMINDFIFRNSQNHTDSFDRRRVELRTYLGRATALLDDAAAESSGRLHCNSRNFRNVLIRLQTKLDKAELSFAWQSREDTARNMESGPGNGCSEGQGKNSIEMGLVNDEVIDEPVSARDAISFDGPFDGWADLGSPSSLDNLFADAQLLFSDQSEWHPLGFEASF